MRSPRRWESASFGASRPNSRGSARTRPIASSCPRRENPETPDTPTADLGDSWGLRRANAVHARSRGARRVPPRVQLRRSKERQSLEDLDTQLEPGRRVVAAHVIPNGNADVVGTGPNVHLQRDPICEVAVDRKRNPALQPRSGVHFRPGAQVDDANHRRPRLVVTCYGRVALDHDIDVFP